MKRRLLNFLTVVSLLACAACVAMWVAGFVGRDGVWVNRMEMSGRWYTEDVWWARTVRGRLLAGWGYHRSDVATDETPCTSGAGRSRTGGGT